MSRKARPSGQPAKPECRTELGRFLDLPVGTEDEIVNALRAYNGYLLLGVRKYTGSDEYGICVRYDFSNGLRLTFDTGDPFRPTSILTRITEDRDQAFQDYYTALVLAGHGDRVPMPEGVDAFFEGLDEDDGPNSFFDDLDAEDESDDFFAALEDEADEAELFGIEDFGRNAVVYNVEDEKFYTVIGPTILQEWDTSNRLRVDPTEKKYLPAHVQE